VFYVQPFSFSPSTMVASEADGAPLQPPHPTMPPYSSRANSRQSSDIKFQAKQPRMQKERHSPFLGTTPYVEPRVSVPTTMANPMTTACPETMFCTVTTTSLTTVTSLQQHNYIKLRGAEHHPETHDHKRCRTRTQRNRHIKLRTNATTTTNHNYIQTSNPKNKNKKNTISLPPHHRQSRLPSIPEKSQLLLPVHHSPLHPRRAVTPPRHHRHRNLRQIQHSDPINMIHSPTSTPSHTVHHQPRSTTTADIVPAYPSPPDSYRNYLDSISNNTQRSIHSTENAPSTTDPATLCSSPLVPVAQLDSQSNLPTCPSSRITTASMVLASENTADPNQQVLGLVFIAPIPTASPASSPTPNHTQPNASSLPLDSPVKTHESPLPSILDSADSGDSFEERMRQQQKCFLETLAEIQQNLLLAQQAFDMQLQLFIAHRNAMPTAQPSHLSTNSLNNCTLPLAAIRSIPEQNMTNQSVDSLAATQRYPSPLNTQFLLPSGQYNNAATGVPWFKSSLFSLVPFQQ